MKKSEIKLGGIYSNGKSGRYYQEREIIGEGAEFVLYHGQEETDNIRYRVVNGKNGHAEKEGNMTRSSFATWAKNIVKASE